MIKLKFYKIAISLITIFLSVQSTAAAQSNFIYGTIKSKNDKVGLAATVIVKDSSQRVVSYVQSDKDGRFRVSRPVSKSVLWLEVNLYGYEKASERIIQGKEEYNFLLEDKPVILEEVKIEAAPIIQYGDTLSFNVQSLSQKEDRSIGDVMRRLPGVAVGEDGSISFNGKKIDNLYIHGDDLMGGRYGMATKTIQKELISRINIIQNHQPIKALQNKVLTDKIAVDLVLKDENSLKVSGNVKAGAGIPGLYEGELSQVALNKKYKMLNSLGANNVGVSYGNHVKDIGASSLAGSISSIKPQISLSLGGAGRPQLPEIYYLRNRSHFMSINNLITLKNQVQLRVNLVGLNDRNTFESNSTITNFLQQDTIRFVEQQLLKSEPKLYDLSVNLMVNKTKYYLNNSTKAGRRTNNDFGEMHFNDQVFDQNLDKKAINISNDFIFIPTFKKNRLLQFRWLLENNTDRQTLNLGSGYRPAFSVNDSGAIVQKTSLPTFTSNSFFSYTHATKFLTQEYKFGFVSEKQSLRSSLVSDDNKPLIENSKNNFTWHRSYPFMHALFQIKTSNTRFDILLPVEYQTVRFSESNPSLNSKNQNLLFSPRLRTQFEFTPEKRLTAEYSFSNSLGDITQLYTNAILLNFRSLTANEPFLQNKNIHHSNVEYRYEKAIAMLFMNIKASYSVQNSNTMLTWEYEENMQKSKTLFLPNQQKTAAINGGISKFFWQPKLRFSLTGSFSSIALDQLINNDLTPIISQNYVLKNTVDKTLFGIVSAEYTFTSSFNTSKSKNTPEAIPFKSNFTSFNHTATLVLNTGKPIQAKLAFIHNKASQTDNNDVKFFFLDFNIGYRPKAKKIEFELNVSNILNQKRFDIYNLNTNQVIHQAYELRGRTSLLKAMYYF